MNGEKTDADPGIESAPRTARDGTDDGHKHSGANGEGQDSPIVTVFPNVFADTKEERPLAEFLGLLLDPPHVDSKEACPLFSAARYGDVLSDRGSIRHNANAREFHAAVGDYDGEEVSIIEARDMLAAANVRATLYTSPSHTPLKPRWRAVCPVSRPLPPEDYERMVARADAALGHILAQESYTLSQSYYFGQVNGGYICVTAAGRCIDLADELDEPGHNRRHGRKDPRTDEQLRACIVKGIDAQVYTALVALSARLAARGVVEAEIVSTLQGLLDEGDWRSRDPRTWSTRRNIDVPKLARSAFARFYREPRSTEPPWPEAIHDDAFHGIAGEIVRLIAPDTEADPVSLLLHVLVFFGHVAGRTAYYKVEGAQHYTNLFAVLVGRTSKGRKGSAERRVLEVFELLPQWKPPVSGLSTGEGLKYHVRDSSLRTETDAKGKEFTTGDEGVDDKRLLAIEPEFCNLLKVCARPGNTMSTALRQAWDTGHLRTLTKRDPIEATNAHISVIGHITADELRAEMSATDFANGFANRHLFFVAQRARELPFGGDETPLAAVGALASRLEELIEKAVIRDRVVMSEAARELWISVYHDLSEGKPGLYGAATARAEAHAVRLALIYALLDGADTIDVPHLRAALAVVAFCDATARHLFGQTLGDKVADEIMRRLRKAGEVGMSRTDITFAFSGHETSARIGAALEMLERMKKVRSQTFKTGGRDAEMWYAE